MKEYVRIFINILFPFVALAVIVVVGWKLLIFFMPFVLAWIISLIANPLIRFLEQKVKIVRKHSSILLVVLVLAGIIALFYFGISWVIREAIYFMKDWPNIWKGIQVEMEHVMMRIQPLLERLPDPIQLRIDGIINNLGDWLSSFISQISVPTIEIAGDVVSKIPGIVVNIFITILSSYFFLADKEKIGEFFGRLIPKSVQHYLNLMKAKCRELIGGYFMAQFRIMFVIFIILMIGFAILGVSYYGLVAFLVAFLDMLPVFGTGTILIPWAVIKLVLGDYYTAVGMIIIYLVTQGVRQLIQPKIVGDSMGLDPMATLVFMYLGFKFQGVAGMILAVPVGLALIELYHIGIFDNSIANMKLLVEKIQDFMDSQEKTK